MLRSAELTTLINSEIRDKATNEELTKSNVRARQENLPMLLLELLEDQYQLTQIQLRLLSFFSTVTDFSAVINFSQAECAAFGLDQAKLAILQEPWLAKLLQVTTKTKNTSNATLVAQSSRSKHTLSLTPHLKLNFKFAKEIFLPEWLGEDQYLQLSKSKLIAQELGLADRYSKFLKKAIAKQVKLNKTPIRLQLLPKQITASTPEQLKAITISTSIVLSAEQLLSWIQLELVVSLLEQAAKLVSVMDLIGLDPTSFRIRKFLEHKFEFTSLKTSLAEQLAQASITEVASRTAQLVDFIVKEGVLTSLDSAGLAIAYKEIFQYLHQAKHFAYFQEKSISLLNQDNISPEASVAGLAQYCELGVFTLKLSGILILPELERLAADLHSLIQGKASEQDLLRSYHLIRLEAYSRYFSLELEAAQQYLVVALDSLLEYREQLLPIALDYSVTATTLKTSVASETKLQAHQRLRQLILTQSVFSPEITPQIYTLNQSLAIKLDACNYQLLQIIEQALQLISLFKSQDFSWELWFAEVWHCQSYGFNALIFSEVTNYSRQISLDNSVNPDSIENLDNTESELIPYFNHRIAEVNRQLIQQLARNYHQALVIASSLLANLQTEYKFIVSDPYGFTQLESPHSVVSEQQRRQQAVLSYWQELHLRQVADLSDLPNLPDLTEISTAFTKEKLSILTSEIYPSIKKSLPQGRDLKIFQRLEERLLQLRLEDSFPYQGMSKQATWLEFLGVANLVKYLRYILLLQEAIDSWQNKRTSSQELEDDLFRLYNKHFKEIRAVKERSLQLLELLINLVNKLSELAEDSQSQGICVNYLFRANSGLFREAVKCLELSSPQLGSALKLRPLLSSCLQIIIADWEQTMQGKVALKPNLYLDPKCHNPYCKQHRVIDFQALKQHLISLKPSSFRAYYPSFALTTSLQARFSQLEAKLKELIKSYDEVSQHKVVEFRDLTASLLVEAWSSIHNSIRFESCFSSNSQRTTNLKYRDQGNKHGSTTVLANLSQLYLEPLKLNQANTSRLSKQLFIAQQQALYRERQDYYLAATRDIRLRNKSFKLELRQLLPFDLFLLSCVLPYSLYKQGTALSTQPELQFPDLGKIRVNKLLNDKGLCREINLILEFLISQFKDYRLPNLLNDLYRLTAQPLIKEMIKSLYSEIMQDINGIKPLPNSHHRHKLDDPSLFFLEDKEKEEIITTLDQLLKVTYSYQHLILAKPLLFKSRDLPVPDPSLGVDLNFILGQSLNQLLADTIEVTSPKLGQIFIKDLTRAEQTLNKIWQKIIAEYLISGNVGKIKLASLLTEVVRTMSVSESLTHDAQPKSPLITNPKLNSSEVSESVTANDTCLTNIYPACVDYNLRQVKLKPSEQLLVLEDRPSLFSRQSKRGKRLTATAIQASLSRAQTEVKLLTSGGEDSSFTLLNADKNKVPPSVSPLDFILATPLSWLNLNSLISVKQLPSYLALGYLPICYLQSFRYPKTIPFDLTRTRIRQSYFALVTAKPEEFYWLSQGNGLRQRLDWQAVTLNAVQYYKQTFPLVMNRTSN